MIKINPTVETRSIIMGKCYLAIAFILAGSSVVAASFVSAHIPPFATTFLSLVFASLTAALFCGKKMISTAKRLSKKTWIVIVLQALFGNFLFRVCLTIGLRYTGTAEAGIITGATPAITALLTFILLHEILTIKTICGIAMTFAGILLVQGFSFKTEIENVNPLGVFCVLGAASCESFFTVLSRKLYTNTQDNETLSPAVHAGYVSIFAMVLSFIPVLIESPWAAIINLPFSGWMALIWYGSIVTIVAFSCMFAGAKRCSGYTIAAFAGIIPISSTILSVVVLNEEIAAHQIAGCILVVIATIVISRKRKTSSV